MKTSSGIATAFKNASESFKSKNKHLGLLPHEKRLLGDNVERSRGIRKGMNKTEEAYSLILTAQLARHEIIEWQFESVKLRIGEGCWYCPDFMVEHPSGQITFIEIKGFLRDDARVKFLAAQEQHKWASFEMWKRDKKQGWTQIL